MKGAVTMKTCPVCKRETLQHKHDCAHGLSFTHMTGTERFECECGFSCWDAMDGEKYGLVFVYDIEDEMERVLREIGI